MNDSCSSRRRNERSSNSEHVSLYFNAMFRSHFLRQQQDFFKMDVLLTASVVYKEQQLLMVNGIS